MIGKTENRGCYAGFPERGFRRGIHLIERTVVPEFAPAVLESGGAGDKEFVADNVAEVVEGEFQKRCVAVVAADFEKTFKTGGHFIRFPVSEIRRSAPGAGFGENIHGICTSGIGETLCPCEKRGFSGETRSKFHRAEDGVCRHPVVPAKFIPRTRAAGKAGDEVCCHAADRFEHTRILFDITVVAAETENRIFASPRIPVLQTLFFRIGADAAVGFDAVTKPPHGVADHLFEFGIGIALENPDCGTDDFPPEFAAPARIAVFMIAEGAHELFVINLFESVFNGKTECVSERTRELDASARKRCLNIFVHSDLAFCLCRDNIAELFHLCNFSRHLFYEKI